VDRYWISRDLHGKNKVVVPSMEDLEKYSKVEKEEYNLELVEKAEICGRIVKSYDPDCSGDELVKRSARLMAKDMFSLKKILDDRLREKRK
jgi:hypothetical protein